MPGAPSGHTPETIANLPFAEREDQAVEADVASNHGGWRRGDSDRAGGCGSGVDGEGGRSAERAERRSAVEGERVGGVRACGGDSRYGSAEGLRARLTAVAVAVLPEMPVTTTADDLAGAEVGRGERRRERQAGERDETAERCYTSSRSWW